MGSTIVETWTTSQALAALLSTPEIRQVDSEIIQTGLKGMFEKPFLISRKGSSEGWYFVSDQPPNGNIGLWMFTAVALGFQRMELFDETYQKTLMGYYNIASEVMVKLDPLENGGWNMFPDQDISSSHNFYTTNLALQGLLHAYEAKSYTGENGDDLLEKIERTMQWLISNYVDNVKNAGWKRQPGDRDIILDGMTLHIYANLLHAEKVTHISLPEKIVSNITKHLIDTGKRDIDHQVMAAEFWVRIGGVEKSEAITFLWYPWAIRGSVLWLERTKYSNVRTEDYVRVRRSLGKLIVHQGKDVVEQYLKGHTYKVAELLFCLSKINYE